MPKHLTSRTLWVWPVVAIMLVAAVFVGLTLADSTPVVAQDAEADAYPPLGPLPPMPQPKDNPITAEKAELGRLLYFDPRMSGDGSLSCNTCHSAADGWGARTPISFGGPGTSHWRNASTILNTGYYGKLNWDGSKKSIEHQNKGAWGGAVAGNLDGALAEERLAQIPEYVDRFEAIWGTEYPLMHQALMAVATYQRTITSLNVPFDKYIEGDETAISEAAIRGYELFTDEAGCIACHNGALVSDDSYHATGVPQNPDFYTSPLKQITFRYEQAAKGVPEEVYRTTDQDLGLYYVTKQGIDKGKFRTPSLRDLCYTSPYMHNGVFGSLEEVVVFYNDGGGEQVNGEINKDPLLQPLGLSDEQQSDLVEFLNSLCGDPVTDTVPELPPYGVFEMGEGGE